MNIVYVIVNDFKEIVGIFSSKDNADKCSDELSDTERQWFKLEGYKVIGYPYPVIGCENHINDDKETMTVYCATDTDCGVQGVFASVKDVIKADIYLYYDDDINKCFPFRPTVYKVELNAVYTETNRPPRCNIYEVPQFL